MPPTLPGIPRPDRAATAWTRVLVIVAACGGLAVLATSDTLHDLLLRVIAVAESVIRAHPGWGISLFIILAALSAMLAFFSTALIVPVAVYTWGNGATIALLFAGWLLGGMCAYAVGRFLGRPVVNALTSGAALARYEALVSQRAPFGLVLLFQFALPSEVPGYVLGIVRYHFGRYIAALSIVELPFAVGTVYLGAGLLARRAILIISIGAAGALLIALAFHLLHKRLAAEREAYRTRREARS